MRVGLPLRPLGEVGTTPGLASLTLRWVGFILREVGATPGLADLTLRPVRPTLVLVGARPTLIGTAPKLIKSALR